MTPAMGGNDSGASRSCRFWIAVGVPEVEEGVVATEGLDVLSRVSGANAARDMLFDGGCVWR